MTMAGSLSGVGTVFALWRYPVKSMQGEDLQSSEVTERGLLGDRSFALLDGVDGKVASAKNPRKWPTLFGFRASYTEPPRANAPLPEVQITLPDGRTLSSNHQGADEALSGVLGRKVSLRTTAPRAPV